MQRHRSPGGQLGGQRGTCFLGGLDLPESRAGQGKWRGRRRRREGFAAAPRWLDLLSGRGSCLGWGREQRGHLPPDVCGVRVSHRGVRCGQERLWWTTCSGFAGGRALGWKEQPTPALTAGSKGRMAHPLQEEQGPRCMGKGRTPRIRTAPGLEGKNLLSDKLFHPVRNAGVC